MAQRFDQAVKESGLLTPDQFKAVSEEQAKVRNSTFYSAIRRTKVMDDETLVRFACEFFGMNRIGNAFKVNVDFPTTCKVMGSEQRQSSGTFSQQQQQTDDSEAIFAAIEARMFAFMSNGKLHFVVNDPESEMLRVRITTVLGREPEFAIITNEEFEVILKYQLTPRAIGEQAKKIKTSATAGYDTKSGVLDGSAASVTQKLLDMLIDAAMERHASDLHLQPMSEREAQVMLRVDGELVPYTTIKSNILPNLRNKLKTEAGVGGENENIPVEGQIRIYHNGLPVDIRINIVKSSLGFDFNLRFISSSIRSLKEFGLSPHIYDQYEKLLHMTKGLVILCGPTGSGKTSLLYAGFKDQLAENKAIFTIEDPVEIILPGVTQIDVSKERGDTYAKLFPSSLRHDPDIVGIGEIRTLDVAQQTVQASNTGHLVFTTLHTNDAIGAISRLINLGMKPYDVGEVVSAVIAQRLVRRVCTNCAEEYFLPADHVWRERYHLPKDQEIRLKRGKGCAVCAGTGYKGRISVNEILINTPDLRDAIQKNATRTEIETILSKHDYKTYIEDSILKAMEGVTTFEEVDKLYADILYTDADTLNGRHYYERDDI